MYPEAEELCDEQDNDCDGERDEGLDEDLDGDGFSVCAGDCDDEEPLALPGGEEVCDGIDNDCDGETDPGFDLDEDGSSDCVDDDGDTFSENDGDCDDSNAEVNPLAEEICDDGIDNDCDFFVDLEQSECVPVDVPVDPEINAAGEGCDCNNQVAAGSPKSPLGLAVLLLAAVGRRRRSSTCP